MLSLSLLEARLLRSFLVVSRERSFRRAAERLDVSQPTLSVHIAQLERTIGRPLFIRGPRGVQLTEAGRALVPRAQVVVQVLDEAVQEARDAADGQAGMIRVAAAPTAAAGLVTEAFRALRRQRPKVRLSLREAYSEEALLMVEEGQVDVAVARGPAERPGLRATTLLEEPLVLITPPGHPLSRRSSIELSELRDEDFVLFGIDSRTTLHATVVSACAQAGFSPRVSCEGAELMTIGRLVEAQVGIALVPWTTALLLQQRQALAIMPVISPRLRSVLIAAIEPRRSESALVTAFLEALQRAADSLPSPDDPDGTGDGRVRA